MEVSLLECFDRANPRCLQQHLALINTHGNTVKDVPAKEFIEVFAKHLKKGNKIKMPDVSSHLSIQRLLSSLFLKLFQI